MEFIKKLKSKFTGFFKNGTNAKNDFIQKKKQSMEDSQGKSNFSGSSYNGPGNVDHEKRDSNMSQRNF